MIRFSILISIYNRLPITKQGLKSLYQALDHYKATGNGGCHFDVIVVDDGSSDGSSLWIAQHYPDVHLLQGTGDLWWSGGTNCGARYAIEKLHSDYLLLWNDDIAPAPDYFLEIEKVFTRNDLSNTVLGSKIVATTTGKIWSVGGYFNKWGKYGMYNDQNAAETGFFECDWQPGMGTFVPSSVVSAKGLYWDEKQFPQYHGDSDFTLRCKENGLAVRTWLGLVIYNTSNNTGSGGKKNLKALWWSLASMRSNYNFKDRLVFYRRHGKKPSGYVGLASTYLFFIGSFFKRNIFRIPSFAASRSQDLNKTF